MALIVQFLGSGDAFGSGGRLQTCLCVRGAGTTFLVDCGSSSMVGIRRFGVDPNEIDAIFLSHLHGDHFGGIPYVMLDAQLVSRRTEPLVIAGPPGTRQRVRAAMEAAFPGSADARRRFQLEVRELELERANTVNGVSVTPFEVIHPCGAPATALRIECDNTILAYSGDTEWCEALIDVARGADLFVAESYFFEKRVPFHLDFATLRANRGALGTRRTILTHMSAEMLSRAGEVDCELAADGLTIEVEPADTCSSSGLAPPAHADSSSGLAPRGQLNG